MLLGITGTLGAGKGTVVEYLKQKGFRHYSCSGYLKEVILARGGTVDRDAYSKLAGEIRGKDPAGLSRILYERILADGASDVIMEALHDVGEAAFVKNIGGVLLGVDADIHVRYERSIARGSEKDHITFEDFTRYIAREEQGSGHHNIRAVMEMTDYTVTNNGSVAELHQQIDQFLATFPITKILA